MMPMTGHDGTEYTYGQPSGKMAPTTPALQAARDEIPYPSQQDDSDIQALNKALGTDAAMMSDMLSVDIAPMAAEEADPNEVEPDADYDDYCPQAKDSTDADTDDAQLFNGQISPDPGEPLETYQATNQQIEETEIDADLHFEAQAADIDPKVVDADKDTPTKNLGAVKQMALAL